MGNALSPFLANIFMADFEFKLSKLKIFPKIWIRYVDDIFCVMKRNTIDRLLVIMNRRHPTIKFTHEIEVDGTLCFLDVQIKRSDTGLVFNVYRKPTMTSRYIPVESNHSIQHKSAAFNSMIHRMITIPMNAENTLTELSEIKRIAKVNGYSENFVDRIYKKQLKKENLRQLTTLTPLSNSETMRRAAITFFPAITSKLQGVFRKHKIDLVYSNRGKLKDVLGNPKDPVEPHEKSGIYQINCDGCDAIYIGQTKRKVAVRFEEHFRSIRLKHPENSNVAAHVLDQIDKGNNTHKVTLDNVTLMKEIRKPSQLDAYESIFIAQKKKEGANLMNAVAGNIQSKLLALVT
jgi:GIY-YIG catalytic domain